LQKEFENALSSEVKAVNIRLREGEYQFSLAKTIASFELELVFPDAKTLIKKLYGEGNAEDAYFVSKIQTILKKMEKSGIVKILPKEKPWELQKYALTSFKFQDVEKNQVVFATEPEIEKTLQMIHSSPNAQQVSIHQPRLSIKMPLLMSVIITSFAVILWTLTQPVVNITIFISAFCIAAICSTILGISIARKNNKTI
jgi:hypothetical protein